jgi:hypothetical protein
MLPIILDYLPYALATVHNKVVHRYIEGPPRFSLRRPAPAEDMQAELDSQVSLVKRSVLAHEQCCKLEWKAWMDGRDRHGSSEHSRIFA